MATPNARIALALALFATGLLAADRARLVATTRVEPGPYSLTLPEKGGVLRGGEERVLAFEVPGRVERIQPEGQRVGAGEVVAQLGAALERAQLAQAELRLREAKADLKRARSLRESQAVSDKAREAAEMAVGLRTAEREVAREQLARRQLRAPIDGVITETRYVPGEVVTSGSPVATLMDLDVLELAVGVPGYQITRVVPGAGAVVSIPAHGDELFEGTVHEVAPAAEPGEHLFEVRVRVPNTDGRLRPGMSARVRIVTRVIEAAVAVPESAVVERDAKRVVFFVIEGRAQSADVSNATAHEELLLLPAQGSARELVLRGQRDLREGMPVRVDNSVLEGLPFSGGPDP